MLFVWGTFDIERLSFQSLALLFGLALKHVVSLEERFIVDFHNSEPEVERRYSRARTLVHNLIIDRFGASERFPATMFPAWASIPLTAAISAVGALVT